MSHVVTICLSYLFLAYHINPVSKTVTNNISRSIPVAVAKVTEVISSSSKSFDDAVEKGIARADKTLKDVKGAWIKDQKVVVDGGKVTEYRVTMKVSFVLKD